MKIIDKASWQIDGGMPKNLVLQHFKTIFTWLDGKDMLTSEGKEELGFGIDETASLHEKLITQNALEFFETRYDDYLKSIKYGNDDGGFALERLYSEHINLSE